MRCRGCRRSGGRTSHRRQLWRDGGRGRRGEAAGGRGPGGGTACRQPGPHLAHVRRIVNVSDALNLDGDVVGIGRFLVGSISGSASAPDHEPPRAVQGVSWGHAAARPAHQSGTGRCAGHRPQVQHLPFIRAAGATVRTWIGMLELAEWPNSLVIFFW